MFSPLPTNTGVGLLAKEELMKKMVSMEPEAAPKDEAAELEGLVWGSQIIARDWILRVPAAFLFATSLVVFLGFLTTTDPDLKFLAMFAFVASMVAAIHYRTMSRIRSMRGTKWLGYDAPIPVREMAVDSFRYSNWLVARIMTVFLFYTIANQSNFGDTYHNIFQSTEAVVATAALGIVGAAYVRIGTDELWDDRNRLWVTVTGVVVWAGSIACLSVVIVDLGYALEDLAEGYFQRSFFFAWIAQPIVEAICIGARYLVKDRYKNGYPAALSVFKDVAYSMLDCYTIGWLALWVGFSCFGDRRLFNTPVAKLIVRP